NSLTPPVDILATDIDTHVLETAERGIYPIDRIEKIDAERQKRFFRRGTGPNEGLCRVIPELQKLLHFRQLNLLDRDYGLKGPYCAVFCRNVMIYFEKPTQYEIITRVQPLLAIDGLFFAGHSESFFHATDLIRNLGRTVYARADSKVGLP
ncbi:MAG TPA: CheR family methyltransferase, partial [Arenimonas sp.]|nr:CheR family methyltransferase [Arenimonas sp.]